MTPRQRVLAAIEHRAPDRTPSDFWAEEATWNRLCTHLGQTDRNRILEHLQVDVRHLTVPSLPERAIGNGLVQNMWGERYVYKQTAWGPVREDVPGALCRAKSLEDFKSFPWPRPCDLDYSHLAEECRRWENHALLYGFADVWQRAALVRGWEGMFLDMVEHPDWVHWICGKFTDFYHEDYAREAEASDGRIDLYLVISDLGGQTGPLISLTMFRQFVAPYLQKMIECIHGLGGKVLYHSCGQIRTFIEDLIQLGVDVLNPIQPVSPEMAPERLKADFGERLAFHGGIDMQNLLPLGSPEEVGEEVEHYCRTLGHHGGYILAPAHLFQPDVPPENILAFYRAGR